MKNFKVSGYNAHGSINHVYVCAENSYAAHKVGLAHGLIHQVTVKKSSVSGGFTA